MSGEGEGVGEEGVGAMAWVSKQNTARCEYELDSSVSERTEDHKLTGK